MTDLTIDRAVQLAEPVRDALPSASSEQREPAPVRGARTGEVRLTRLLALVALSPAQAVEVGAGLLAVVDSIKRVSRGIRMTAGLRSTGSRSTWTAEWSSVPRRGPAACQRRAGAGAPARGDAALLGELAGAVRAQVGPGTP